MDMSIQCSLFRNHFNMATLMALFLLNAFFFLLFKFALKKRSRLPPGPKGWPFVGCLFTMMRHESRSKWLLKMSAERDITCVPLGNSYAIIVNTPEIAKEFLRTQDANFASRPLTMASEYSGGGHRTTASTPYGEQWKKMRRAVSTVLNLTMLRNQVQLRREEADHILSYAYNQCKHTENSTGVINTRRLTRYYSCNVIRRMLFGTRWFETGKEHPFNGPSEDEVNHVEAAFSILSLLYAYCISDFLPWLRILDLDGHEKIMKGHINVVHRLHNSIIAERLKEWKDGEEKDKKEKDILDAFISLKDDDGKPLLTHEEIRAQCVELTLATIDNTSNIVEWALAHLIDQPAIYAKAMEELDRVVGKERLVEESDFPQLPYIRAICREMLRMHPVAVFNLPHIAIADSVVAGYLIPKGSWVLLSRIGLGRNPRVWDDPHRFNPDRHLNDPAPIELAEPELRFISFTAGRRSCMGYALGSWTTYMLLARLLQAFEWSLAPGETKGDFAEGTNTMFKAKPYHACAKPRLPRLLDKLL